MTARPPDKAPLWFDFWAAPSPNSKLALLAADIQETIEANEERTRKRKSEDQLTFSRCVEVVVANLALSALTGVGLQQTGDAQHPMLGIPATSIGVPLNERHPIWRTGRYSRHGLKQETFRKLVDAMHGEFLSFERSTWRGTASNIRPTPEFVQTVSRHGVTASDIGRVPDCRQETIVLTRKSGVGVKEWIEYNDTPETTAMREEMASLNRYLEAAPLAFVNDGGQCVCLAQRRLTRRFILPNAEHPKTFEHGGRLYGGFWERLSRERRRESLRIDGERIAEADLNAVFLRLASAMGGCELDYASDPYSALLCSLAPGLQGYRRGLKGAVSSLLFAPNATHWSKELRAQLPKGLTPKRLRQGLAETCPGLTPFLGAGAPKDDSVPIGFSLFRKESDILLAALRLLRKAGVTALPLHDAVLVPERAADFAKECLERSARDVAGAACGRSVRIPAKVWKASSE